MKAYSRFPFFSHRVVHKTRPKLKEWFSSLVDLNRFSPVFCRAAVAEPPPAALRTQRGGGGRRAFVATASGKAFVDTVQWSGPVYWPLTLPVYTVLTGATRAQPYHHHEARFGPSQVCTSN